MNEKNWGGKRPGAGQPRKNTKSIHVMVDAEAYEIYQKVEKKGEFVSEAIKKLKEQ
mgnify:CR=1 FL=1|jgi:hypothetical protein